MARTSKTVIGKGSGEMNDRMMRAQESGHRMVSAERDRMDNLRRENQQNYSHLGQGLARSFDNQAAREQQQSQFDAQMQQRGQQFERQMANDEARTDLEGAKAGFERGGGGNDRAAKLQAEMDRGASQTGGGTVGAIGEQEQQNLREQSKKPLEMDGGQWRPSEQGQQIQQRKSFEADTERMRAETYRDQVGASVQKAKMQGNKDEAQQLQTTLAAPVNQMGESYDRFMNDKATEGDWRNLAKMASGIEGFDPSIKHDIEGRNWSPRLQSMMRANQSQEALKYVVRTGDTSNLKTIDWTSPQMQQFTQNVAHFNALAKSLGPEFAQFAGIRSIEDKMSFLNMQAAISVITGMDTAPDPTGGAMPSSGGPMGGEEQGQAPVQMRTSTRGTSDPYATDEAGLKAAADRRAGATDIPPTDSAEFRRRYGGANERKPSFGAGFGPK